LAGGDESAAALAAICKWSNAGRLSLVDLAAQAGNQIREVPGQRRLPAHPAASCRMLETQDCGVEGDSAKTAFVWQRFSMEGPVVDALAAKGRACLTQVDAYLVSTASLESTLHKREIPKVFHDANVGYGELAGVHLSAATATAITAVCHQA
jgi:hypothetical protein